MQRSILKTKILIFNETCEISLSNERHSTQKYDVLQISKRAHKSDLYELRIHLV